QATGDGVDDQVVERAVEEREGGALAGRAERRALREATAALHVAGGQRPEGAPQFRPGEVGQVTRFRGGQPTGEAFRRGRHPALTPSLTSGPWSLAPDFQRAFACAATFSAARFAAS